MITVYSTLRDGAGDEIEHGQSSAVTVAGANNAADAWAHGRLAGCDDPDAYVEHVWTQSQPESLTPTADSLGIDTSKDGWLTEYARRVCS